VAKHLSLFRFQVNLPSGNLSEPLAEFGLGNVHPFHLNIEGDASIGVWFVIQNQQS
jgi:hypothetical protein